MFKPKSIVVTAHVLMLFFSVACVNVSWAGKQYFVQTVSFHSGGPEALLQLFMAMRKAGLDVYHADVHPEHVQLYRQLGLLSSEDVARVPPSMNFSSNWVVIRPEVAKCDESSHARQFIWLLAINGHFNCTLLSHSYHISRAYGVPMYSTLLPYMSPIIWNYTDILPKMNIVVVDNDAHELVNGLVSLKEIVPDLEVVTAVGRNKHDMYRLLSQAKVVVDANMRGLERIIYEGRILGAVPICERASVGSDPWDTEFMPIEHTFVPGNLSELRTAVLTALRCHQCELSKTSHWLKHARNRQKIFEISVSRFFESDALFVVYMCRGSPDPWVTAVSILLSMPASSVTIVVPLGFKSSILVGKDKLVEKLMKSGLWFSISIVEQSLSNMTRCLPASTTSVGHIHTWTDVIFPHILFQRKHLLPSQHDVVVFQSGLLIATLNRTPYVPASANLVHAKTTHISAHMAFSLSLLDTLPTELIADIVSPLCKNSIWIHVASDSASHPALAMVC